MLKRALILLGLFLHLAPRAQNLPAVEERLARLGRRMLQAPAYAERKAALQRFETTLDSLMRHPAGYAAPLESVKNMLKLKGPQGDFRLFTWQMPDSAYTLKRHGMVVVSWDDTVRITHLKDALARLRSPITRAYGPEQWPGALYYKLLPEGPQEGRYTLLGFAPGKPENRKIVEVLKLDEQGGVTFGAPIFRVEKLQNRVLQKPPQRLIFRYSGKRSATLHWNEEEGKVIMDHLAPPSPKLKGMYRRYGPNFTYDALEWRKGWWHLEEDVEVAHPKR
jgi:hypothetical protein